MADKLSPREMAQSRALAGGAVKVASFKAVGKGQIRSLDMNVINEGDVVTIPKNYEVLKDQVFGNDVAFIITEEGANLYPGCFTRGALPDAANGDRSQYVRPSGTAVEMAQQYADFDSFFNAIAGRQLKFTSKQTVEHTYRGNTEPTMVNVWTIDLVPETEKSKE